MNILVNSFMSSNLAQKNYTDADFTKEYRLGLNSRYSGFVDLSGKAEVSSSLNKNSTPQLIARGKLISGIKTQNKTIDVDLKALTETQVIPFIPKHKIKKSLLNYSKFFQFILCVGISATCVIGYNSYNYSFSENKLVSYKDLKFNLENKIDTKKSQSKNIVNSASPIVSNIKVSYRNGKKINYGSVNLNNAVKNNLSKITTSVKATDVLPSEHSVAIKVYDIIKNFLPNKSEGLKLAYSVVEESKKADYDPLFVAAVIKSESGFNRFATSPVGAKGLMQLMPATGKYVAGFDQFKNKPKGYLTDAGYNLKLGIAYLKYLDSLFGNNKVLTLISYNWGPAKVANSVEGKNRGVPKEVMNYALKILSDHQKWHKEILASETSTSNHA